MNMVVLGLDLSLTCSGFGLLSGDECTGYGHFKTDNLRGIPRLSLLRKKILYILKTTDPGLVVVEDYAFAGKGKVIGLGELGGVVKTAIHELGYPLLVAPPSTIRANTVGKGNASKEEVCDYVSTRLGVNPSVFDESDALACAIFGRHLLSLQDEDSKAFQKLLNKVSWQEGAAPSVRLRVQ